MEKAANGALPSVGGEPTLAAHRQLYALPLDEDVMQAAPRQWAVMSPDGARSAVRTAATKLSIVKVNGASSSRDASQRAQQRRAYGLSGAQSTASMNGPELAGETVSLMVPHAVMDFAFSNCGEYLAVADAGGVLHLFKSETGKELFAYPVVAPSSTASDSIQAVVFAKTALVADEDLIVLTRAGVLIRLGKLKLVEIEQTLARELSHNSALRVIMASIQLQQTQVGRLNEDAESILVARRYTRSLFVTIANHGAALSVWTATNRDTTIKKHAVYDILPDGEAVKDAKLAMQDRYLAVLSRGGALTWWDWRELVLLCPLQLPNIESFTSMENSPSSTTEGAAFVIAVSRQQNPGEAFMVQVVNVHLSIQGVQVDEVVQASLPRVEKPIHVALSSLPRADSYVHGVFVAQVDEGAVKFYTIDPQPTDRASVSSLVSPSDDLMSSEGIRDAQDLRMAQQLELHDEEIVRSIEGKLESCFREIGHDLENSRLILECLLEFSKRVRQSQASATVNLHPRVFEWLDRIASTSYKWTTFTLLLSSVNRTSHSGQAVSSRWQTFCSANLLDIMCHYIKRGMMRAVSLLWERHVREEAVASIAMVLRHLPKDLPFVSYERWLHSDVVPSIVQYIEQRVDRGSSGAVDTVESFATWILERALHFAEKEDIETSLKLCSLLLQPRESPAQTEEWRDPSTTGSLRWALLRLGEDLNPSSESGVASTIGRMEQLSRQLEHMRYLESIHGFKISLSVFAEETPTTIAMSMLDRCTSADAVKAEIRDHVASYLRHCGKTTDPVLLEYITEVLESSPTTSSTSEQARLLAIIDEISDVEIRTKAILLFFGSLLPPFSPQVKQFTKKCVTWDTRQIDTMQEHIRLMDIQDMLTGYGVAHFKVGDPRTGSRLVSHILTQISRDSAFVDALQLVRAYSHLSVERAALEYLENVLTQDSSSSAVGTTRETLHRSNLIKSAISELKKHYALTPGDSWRILPVMEEVISLGMSLLELKEAEDELQRERQRPQSSGVVVEHEAAFFLGLLEVAVETFLSESSDVEVPSSEDFSGATGAERSAQSILHPSLLSSIQRIRRIHNEWGVIVSVKTIRDPELVADRVKLFIQPEVMFSGIDLTQVKVKPGLQPGAGKGKKRAIGSSSDQVHGDAKRLKTSSLTGLPQLRSVDEQQDDLQTKLAFDLHRYATHLGMNGDDYHSLVAQAAAEHGDILKAVQFSRDLFSRRRGASFIAKREEAGAAGLVTSGSGLALKNISLSISKYTAMHTEEIYNLAIQGHGHHQQGLTSVQFARMQAPMYSLELLRYAICVCDSTSFEETLVLLKNATLLNDILRFTQLGSISFGGDKKADEEKWRIYNRWFREETFCVLPSAQTMNLATRFAISEHRLLMEYGSSNAVGLLDASTPIPSTELLASKRFVSFLVENNADLLSLQVILSMQWVPEDALTVIQGQVNKLLSTVFQSHSIDNFLALGLMLTMDQRDAFNAFRRQISRENVAKDFNRFQRLAKVGADSARAWQQIAFLNQCVELEGNARWWHYLNLLDIPCEHKSFQGERRDMNYIRTLVPALLAKSSYDYYTIQEFTRHYQIDDSYPALVYVEALLTNPEAATGSKSLEYQDKIVGVLEDIHEQKLVSLLLKTLPQIPGTDYERLLFVFQLLLEHTTYGDKEEIERRIEILHVLKAFGVRGGESGRSNEKICFHQMMSKPREVLSEVLTTRSFGLLSNLALPLRLESDELLMLLLKNVIGQRKKSKDSGASEAVAMKESALLSGSELERLFGILSSLRATESKITAGEWLAEHLPLSTHKLRSLEFALEAVVASSNENGRASVMVASNTTFMGIEALTRLELKVLRVKVQLIFLTSNARRFFDEGTKANLLQLLAKQPREVFYDLYRLTDATSATATQSAAAQDEFSLHRIADRIAEVLKLRADELRVELVRELLVKDAVYVSSQKSRESQRSGGEGKVEERVFTTLEEEVRSARDEVLIKKISSIASKVAQDSVDTGDSSGAVTLVEYLVTFARDTKPRAGVTFRAKLRAARTVLHLAQSHRSAVVAAVESKMKLAAFDVVIKELVDYIRHCKHMIVFEEHRVPYEIGFVIRAKKEALVRSLLRQHSGKEAWVLRCVSNLMLDFNVQAPDLWEFALTNMKQLGMFRSLSRVLAGLSQHAFVRGINGASEVWEATLLSPLRQLKSMSREPETHTGDTNGSRKSFHGVSVHSIRSELELMVAMLQRCPFLDQVDVAAFVVHLRDLTMSISEGSALAEMDLYSYAVRCATVIPRPSARLQALQRIIQAGAYMQVLAQVCDASVLFDEPLQATDRGGPGDWLGEGDNDEMTEQLALLEAIFTEAAQRDEHEKLLGSPFEQGFLEFLAATGNIDRVLAILLRSKRLEAASTLVELFYESHPDRAPAGWTISELVASNPVSSGSSRWKFLQQYVAGSTSVHLAEFREMAQ